MKNLKLVLLTVLSVPTILLSCKKSSTGAPQHHYVETNTAEINVVPVVVVNTSTSFKWIANVSVSFNPIEDSVVLADQIQYDVYDGTTFVYTKYPQGTNTYTNTTRNDTLPSSLVAPNIQNIISSHVTYVSNGSINWTFGLHGAGLE